MKLTEIFTRASAACTPNVVLSASTANIMDWVDDGIKDLGSGTAPLITSDVVIVAGEWTAMPWECVSIEEVKYSDGGTYGGRVPFRNGKIKLLADDTYEITWRRIPGPAIHNTDDTNDVDTDDSEDVTTLIALANALKAAYNTHIAATAYHKAADATNAVSSVDATDLATAITLINEMKGDFNTHRSQTGVHYTDDPYHLVQSPNATTQTTADTLVNEIKRLYNRHLGSGLPEPMTHVALAWYLAYRYKVQQNPNDSDALRLDAKYQEAKANALSNVSTGPFMVERVW